MNIAALAIKRPVTTFMVFICLVVLGGLSSRLVPLEFMPDITFPGVFIRAPYPGSTPEETEKLIIRPVEEVLATISGVTDMFTNSRENEATVFLRFKMGVDTDLKIAEVREKLDAVRDELPSDLERFFVFKFSESDSPILNVRLSSDLDLANAYEMLNRHLKQRIERIDGVSQVNMYGVEKKQVTIELINDRIIAHRINLNELVQRLQRSNFSLSAGKIDDGAQRFSVRPVGEITRPEDIGDIIISDIGLKLKDVAIITYEKPRVDYGRHLDRKYAIGMEIFKENGANTVAVSKAIMKEIDEIGKTREMHGIKIFTMFNQAEGITSSLNELLKAGATGAVLSVVVLFFFLRSLSSTMIVALAVPFSLLVTIGALYFMGLTLNLLTMMGLMVAVGMLVDNAVVITENIHRNQKLGLPNVQAAIIGVKEVGIAVTAGTLTSIIVFLPNIVTKSDMMALYLKHVAVTICVALLASLLISLTVIPLLTSKLAAAKHEEKEDNGFVERIVKWYGRVISWILDHRYTSALLVFGTIFSMAIPMQFVKTEMFPNSQDRELRLFYNINGNYVLEKVEETVFQVEDYLYENKDEFEIESVYSYFTPNYAFSSIVLKRDDDAQKSVDEIKDAIKANWPKLTIGKLAFEYQSMSGNERLQVHLHGESTEELIAMAEEVVRRFETIPGLENVRSEAETGTEEVRLVVDRERARNLGVSSLDVASLVSSALRGTQLRRIRTREGEIDVHLKMQDNDRKEIADVMNLPIGDSEQGLRVASLASAQIKSGPGNIRRENRRTSIAVTATLNKITPNEARTKIEHVMKSINYPSGYGWSFGRSFRNDDETMNNMLINMLLALVMIYLVMASLFESALMPVSILTSIIYGVVGVYWFFFITGTSFSFMAMIGILVLMGVVVNNGIVLIDHINQLRAEGMERKQAIITGGMNRLRPILMTAGTTVLGLIPLCLGDTRLGGDGPSYYPMARAIVGGLTFSTMVTMLILPSIYIMLDDVKLWSSRVVESVKPTTMSEPVAINE